MKRYVRVRYRGKISWGIIEGDSVIILDAAPWNNPNKTGEKIGLDKEKLRAPAEPTKIVLIGLNYHDHIKESQSANEVPDEPVIFMKPTTAVTGPNDQIPYPPGLDRVDYEGELACVIGERIHDVDEEGTKQAIFGYTILNDVTARKLQKKDVQWTRGKGFDGFAPVGPWIVTDIDPLDLKIETYLNDELRQSARTSLQIWNVYQLVSFISKVMTLLPGDIVSTGTPEGVGPFRPGDTVRIEIENIGMLENRVSGS
ncbi:MAG: fumarylacetoacetate hydrolase family protein [Candidatus Zixiibacteriota bacterium]|nr:MAG: fumarylacetoacetate hydrolase family protein [candidate division Zixibacteria bacterium]